MATIFFSMSGEGRGHATRVRSTVEMLRGKHRIRLFCPGDAYTLLAPVYEGTDVRVDRIPGLVFEYDQSKRLDVRKTAAGALKYARGFRRLRGHLERTIRAEKPDLIVTDFEPALPRAAKRCGVPFASINHQHFLLACDLSSLPPSLRWHAKLMSLVVRSYYSGQAATVISQFYFPPLKPSWKGRARMTGVLMRPDILAATPTVGAHVVAYVRKFASDNLMRALRESGREVRLYGLGKLPDEGNIRYRAIDDAGFLRDLASSRALVCTAGNQLVGEALFLRKPVFALPEPNNKEQYINAHYLKESGGGDWCPLETATPARLRRFLDARDEFAARIDAARMNGNGTVLRTIEELLERRAP